MIRDACIKNRMILREETLYIISLYWNSSSYDDFWIIWHGIIVLL